MRDEFEIYSKAAAFMSDFVFKTNRKKTVDKDQREQVKNHNREREARGNVDDGRITTGSRRSKQNEPVLFL